MLVKKFNNQYYPSIFDAIFNNESIEKGHDVYASPSYNVYESDKDYVVEFAIPGFEKSNFSVELKNSVLEISCEKENKSESKEQNYIFKGFSYGSFKKSFSLPENVNYEEISANYENGLLKVIIPKGDKTKASKQITIS